MISVDAMAQMKDWIAKTEALEKELSDLEREAKKLAEKQETIHAERQSLNQQIAEHKKTTNTLEQEDTQVKDELLEAMLADDTAQERTLKQRRKQIATELQQHRKEIRGLRDSIGNLDDTGQEAATIAARLDMLAMPGDAFIIGSRLRDALVRNQRELKARQGAVKRELPKYSQDVYGEVRAELDEECAAREKRGSMSEVEHENFQKKQQERENKDAAASREYVGVGTFGGQRRSEPDRRDFSS